MKGGSASDRVALFDVEGGSVSDRVALGAIVSSACGSCVWCHRWVLVECASKGVCTIFAVASPAGDRPCVAS